MTCLLHFSMYFLRHWSSLQAHYTVEECKVVTQHRSSPNYINENKTDIKPYHNHDFFKSHRYKDIESDTVVKTEMTTSYRVGCCIWQPPKLKQHHHVIQAIDKGKFYHAASLLASTS